MGIPVLCTPLLCGCVYDWLSCAHVQEQSDAENRVYTEYIKVPLDSGSLLIMDGAIQHDWQVWWRWW